MIPRQHDQADDETCPTTGPPSSPPSPPSSRPVGQYWSRSDVQGLFDALVVGAETLHRVEEVERARPHVVWVGMARQGVERVLSDLMMWAHLNGVRLRLPPDLGDPLERRRLQLVTLDTPPAGAAGQVDSDPAGDTTKGSP